MIFIDFEGPNILFVLPSDRRFKKMYWYWKLYRHIICTVPWNHLVSKISLYGLNIYSFYTFSRTLEISNTCEIRKFNSDFFSFLGNLSELWKFYQTFTDWNQKSILRFALAEILWAHTITMSFNFELIEKLNSKYNTCSLYRRDKWFQDFH